MVPDSAAQTQANIANLPNLLSGIRFVGAFVVIGLALAQLELPLLLVIVVLLLTDWFDGKLAVRWHQQTVFGARLDSLADVSFYSAVLFAMAWLRSDLVQAEVWWLVPAMAAYAFSSLAGLIKFRRIPTYHTRGAKLAWVVCTLTILGVLWANQGWPLRVAGVWVLLVNIEAILITRVLPNSQVDVPSLSHALQLRRRTLAGTLEGDRAEPR